MALRLFFPRLANSKSSPTKNNKSSFIAPQLSKNHGSHNTFHYAPSEEFHRPHCSHYNSNAMRKMCFSYDSRQSACINQPNNILRVRGGHSSKGGECLDEDCSNFCNGCNEELAPKELECSLNGFSLDMSKLLKDFAPSCPSSMATTSLVINPSNQPQPIPLSLSELGSTTNTVTTDPRLLIYPALVQRVERYFGSFQQMPQGSACTLKGRPIPFSKPTQSLESTEITDSATLSSGSCLEAVPGCTCSACSLTKGGTTNGQGTVLDVIKEISNMRGFATGAKPFNPSRYLDFPSGIPNARGNNYLGTMSASSNQVSNLPDYLNTCVWVEGAPADLTHTEMLRSIRNCGKIFSLHINPPSANHFTAAAKIAFCTRKGAELFLSQAQSRLGLVIRGQRLFARWNRNKYRENFNHAESRVLRISGPERFVNRMTMERYFTCLFYFHLIRVDELSPGVTVWEFGSILAQAHSAKQAIEREPAFQNLVLVEYEKDPCE